MLWIICSHSIVHCHSESAKDDLFASKIIFSSAFLVNTFPIGSMSSIAILQLLLLSPDYSTIISLSAFIINLWALIVFPLLWYISIIWNQLFTVFCSQKHHHYSLYDSCSFLVWLWDYWKWWNNCCALLAIALLHLLFHKLLCCCFLYQLDASYTNPLLQLCC